MTTVPTTISWPAPPLRPQYHPINLNRTRIQDVSTVNDSWSTTPYVPSTCDVIPSHWMRKFRSIVDYKRARFDPVKQQPRRSDRKYRPWSWEFQGARLWPWLTNEQYANEELRLRHDRKMPHRQPMWTQNPPQSPSIYAIEDYVPPPCRAPVRQTCCGDHHSPVTERSPPAPLTYANFVNSQWR